MTSKLCSFNKLFSFVVSVILLAVAVVTNPVYAYTFFTDRDAWLSAVSELSILEETFDSIPDGMYPAGTIPSDVFANLELSVSNPLPMAIMDGKVVPVVDRDFSVYMSFFQPVLAVGLDVINPDNVFFQYLISEQREFANPVAFGFFGTGSNIDFLGWVADEGDNPVTETFVFFDPAGREGFAWDNLRVAEVPDPAVQEVSIDIKPSNKQNVINPRAKGGVWVAILSDTDPKSPFDPSSQVDIPTVEFGPDGAKAIRQKVKDINKDGLGDLLLLFEIPDTGIACGDTEATLVGETFYGVSFTGTDSIKTVGCGPRVCHKKHHHEKHHGKNHDDDCDDDEKHHGKHKEMEHHERYYSKHHDDDRDDNHKKR